MVSGNETRGVNVAVIGTAMFICWTLVLGPLGAVCLLGLYYAMIANSLALGIVCLVVLSLPAGLTIAWAVLGWRGAPQKMLHRYYAWVNNAAAPHDSCHPAALKR